MALFAKTQTKHGLSLNRPGFFQVRPVLNHSGEERFGVIELSPECAPIVFFEAKKPRDRQTKTLVGGLRLFGAKLNLWLADEREEQDFWYALTAALPGDCAAQFILHRRPTMLETHYASIREAVCSRLPDHETAYLYLDDYLENLVYPTEEAGLVQQEAYLMVSAHSEEELGDRLAIIYATLPCDATPCHKAELELLLQEYGVRLTPSLWDDHLKAVEPRSYWAIVAPPPSTEGGWTRPLLESEELSGTSFDIVAHLTPGKADPNMRLVLQRRQASLLAMLKNSEEAGTVTASNELGEQLSEVERRLKMLDTQGQRFFEVSICLSLRSTEEDYAEETERFEFALLDAKLSPRRITGDNGLELAWIDCAPLNLPQLARLFVVGEQSMDKASTLSAGRLCQFATAGGIGLPLPGIPLVGYSRAGEPFFLDPGVGLSLFMAGEPETRYAYQAHNLIKYLVAMRYMSGQRFCVFDLNGEWEAVASQLKSNGAKVWQHPYNWVNLLEAKRENLQTLDEIQTWLDETGRFLAALLGLDGQEGLESLLLGAVVALQTEETPLNPSTLWERAVNDGNEPLAKALSRLVLDGDLAWLFMQEEETGIPTEDLLVFGFDRDEVEALPLAARRMIMARLYARLALLFPARTVILDEAGTMLQEKEAAAVTLEMLQQRRNLWVIASSGEELLLSQGGVGRWLIEHARTHIFFRQNGPVLLSIARRLGMSPRATRAIRELACGAAIVRRKEGGEVLLSAFEPLPGDYLTRLAVNSPVVNPVPALPAHQAAIPAPDEHQQREKDLEAIFVAVAG